MLHIQRPHLDSLVKFVYVCFQPLLFRATRQRLVPLMHLLSTREIPVRALVLLAQVTYANDFLALQVGSAYQFKRAVKPEHADTMSRLVDLRARVTPNHTRYSTRIRCNITTRSPFRDALPALRTHLRTALLLLLTPRLRIHASLRETCGCAHRTC